MNDREVLRLVKNGEEKALDYLYKKYFKMMERLIRSNSGSTQDAKDVYQDALIIFWQKAVKGELVLTSKISTYLYSICGNLWKKELSRRTRLSHEQKEEATYTNYDQVERAEIIQACLDKLGPICKQLLMLYYFDGLSMDDIAERLNMANSDTAKTKKYKCKKRLDTLIRKEFAMSDLFD